MQNIPQDNYLFEDFEYEIEFRRVIFEGFPKFLKLLIFYPHIFHMMLVTNKEFLWHLIKGRAHYKVEGTVMRNWLYFFLHIIKREKFGG